MASDTTLDTTPDNKRYARQTRLPDVGREMQEKLRLASVVVAGDDIAARVCALYLAGAGVGDLRVASALASDVAAINADVVVRGDSSAALSALDDAPDDAPSDARVASLDPAAASVADGALRALSEMKAIFAR